MAPSADSVDKSSDSAGSDDTSEPVAAERELPEDTTPGNRRYDRSELYRRMKRVDPGLARRYRQLEGQ